MADDQMSFPEPKHAIDDQTLEDMLTSEIFCERRIKAYEKVESELKFLTYITDEIKTRWKDNVSFFFSDNELLARKDYLHVVRESVAILLQSAEFLSETTYKRRELDQGVSFNSGYHKDTGFFSEGLSLLEHMGYLSVHSQEDQTLRQGVGHDVYLTLNGVELVETYRKIIRD